MVGAAATDSAGEATWIDAAFPPSSQRTLNTSVRKAIAKNPQFTPLLNSIGSYILSLNSPLSSDEPAVKKRKLDATVPTAATGEQVLTLKELSFSVPQREKFSLIITSDAISAITPVSENVEFTVRMDDVQFVACLPVPDKAARQWNFVIIPTGGDGLKGNANAIVFTIPDGIPKIVEGPGLSSGYDSSSYKSLLIAVFNSLLTRPHQVEEPDVHFFTSALAQSHRKGEKAFHVKAHRGSKEGYLYFMRHGILWAFKKPLLYFSFTLIESVAYTSITKRTFDLAVSVKDGGSFEFGMIDQEEYLGVDTYIKAHCLNDASLAEQRKAKTFINGEAEVGELEKALDDVEEEEEEDYIPGQEDPTASGSESESGNESDSETGSEDMGSEDEGSVDLDEELGSEKEQVDADRPREKRNNGRK